MLGLLYRFVSLSCFHPRFCEEYPRSEASREKGACTSAAPIAHFCSFLGSMDCEDTDSSRFSGLHKQVHGNSPAGLSRSDTLESEKDRTKHLIIFFHGGLCGFTSSGAAWRSHLASVLHKKLDFAACRADNDVWFRPAQRKNGSLHDENVLVYTDDILCISMDPDSILCPLDQRFLRKPDSMSKPTQHLGASVKENKIKPSTEPPWWTWAMGSEQYVKEAICNAKPGLKKGDLF
ncbi:unknown protein [Seminavis robusta]|uniref:Uncharacterized protein n=1 Tax=Seminavis robusta TaxID=568900 RepID=A0A9N8D6P7_9STRA|nr:unknown protein [Seminavis robusta]|eukprot:Sro19_g013671.1  (234) ;mRNA; r:156550-157251